MWFKVGISLQPGSFQLDVSRGTVQGPSPLAGASVPWDLGGTKHATGIVIPGLKCCFNFSDILRGLFPYTVNYTWHLYMDLKVKYNQNLFRVPPQVSGTGVGVV